MSGGAPLEWRPSSRCDTGACVEIARSGDDVLVRSSLRPGAVLRLTATEFQTFCNDLVRGRYGLLNDRD
jgi:hypothetical protein